VSGTLKASTMWWAVEAPPEAMTGTLTASATAFSRAVS
jgi:hypothetical protein